MELRWNIFWGLQLQWECFSLCIVSYISLILSVPPTPFSRADLYQKCWVLFFTHMQLLQLGYNNSFSWFLNLFSQFLYTSRREKKDILPVLLSSNTNPYLTILVNLHFRLKYENSFLSVKIKKQWYLKSVYHIGCFYFF